MILFQFLLMVFLMGLAWYMLKFLFREQPELRVMGVFGCVEKTVSLGIPLISSIYEGNPNEALYTLPILIWHPMQLVVGSLIVSRLAKFVESEREVLRQEKEKADELPVVEDVEAPESEVAAENHAMGPQQINRSSRGQ
jgi:solute carrier family 10 (sodium/bile acid cotransporter), member 7